jgi:hypothetical protein
MRKKSIGARLPNDPASAARPQAEVRCKPMFGVPESLGETLSPALVGMTTLQDATEQSTQRRCASLAQRCVETTQIATRFNSVDPLASRAEPRLPLSIRPRYGDDDFITNATHDADKLGVCAGSIENIEELVLLGSRQLHGRI